MARSSFVHARACLPAARRVKVTRQQGAAPLELDGDDDDEDDGEDNSGSDNAARANNIHGSDDGAGVNSDSDADDDEAGWVGQRL